MEQSYQYTVIGASGFLGRSVVTEIEARKLSVLRWARGTVIPKASNLGVIIYCAGRAGNFLDDPYDTVDGHVGLLSSLLSGYKYERLIYVSSTRVYRNAGYTNEDSPIVIRPAEKESLYDIVKLLGENLTISNTSGRGVVARVSTILDPDFKSQSMLRTIYEHASEGVALNMRTSSEAARDIVAVDDVVSGLLLLAEGKAKHTIYNIAGGKLISNEALLNVFSKYYNINVTYNDEIRPNNIPVSNSRMVSEFGWVPKDCALLIQLILERKQRETNYRY